MEEGLCPGTDRLWQFRLRVNDRRQSVHGRRYKQFSPRARNFEDDSEYGPSNVQSGLDGAEHELAGKHSPTIRTCGVGDNQNVAEAASWPLTTTARKRIRCRAIVFLYSTISPHSRSKDYDRHLRQP